MGIGEIMVTEFFKPLWEILLPGFTWISWESFFIGLIGVIIYGIYVTAVFVPIYNYFRGNNLPELK